VSLLSALAEGLDRRLGWREARARRLAELTRPQPAGAGWGAAIGTTAAAILLVEFATGIALALHYRASADAARASVARIDDVVRLGWLLRSVHAWGVHFLVGLALLHAARCFLFGAHKRPRELTWLSGALLLAVVLGFSITGHVLPMDDASWWSTVIRLGHTRAVPVAGPPLASLLAGGEPGPETLTRFYIMHVALLPAALLPLLCLHWAFVRRLGLAPGASADEEISRGHESCCDGGEPWIPARFLRAGAAAAFAVATLLTAAALWPPALGPKAGPETPAGLKPEWFFLALYQFLKYFGAWEGLGHVLALLAIAAFALLPWLDRSPERRPSLRKRSLAIAAAVILAWASLTFLGAVSGRDLQAFGRNWSFDDRGLPK
jgi:quinol-cytochrome oxidoreductase complex cytochrome b subunit